MMTGTHFMALAMMNILMTKILRVVIDINNNSDLIGSAVALSPRFTTLVQVYSLARGSWKSLSASVIPVDFKGGSGRPVFVAGTIHMLKARFTSSYYDDGDIVITTFNLATEEFGEMMGPEALLQKGCSISRYGDSLALIKHLNYEFRDRGCDIWVMRQYGVAESWTRLFHISVAQASIHGFKRSGEVVLEENIEEDIDLDRSRLMSFDPKSDQYLVLGTGDHSYYFMDSFVESLVLLDHCDSISYQVARTKN
uniref:F-box protein CPR30-like isoform X2 n=1 Tax=Fragaria vesca subsp. vesca TaxID=101020 RepID=UPI0005C9C731|nr:PREDICTED: F-box protein CPR30-like isoform X2 [Fragaria vesca subsp. vesca]